MKDEGTAAAKMKHIKQNESQGCGAKIVSFQQKYCECFWKWKCQQLPEKVSSGMQVSYHLIEGVSCCVVLCKTYIYIYFR